MHNFGPRQQNDNVLPIPTPPQDIATSSSAAKGKQESSDVDTNRRFEKLIPPVSLPIETFVPGVNVWPQNEAAEALCFVYRDELSIYFPFVTPPNEPVSVLQCNHPCLFKAMVMAASYQNRSLQMQRGAALTEDLSKRLLIDGEKSRDILQALLLSIAWYDTPVSIIAGI